jgi:hypothetical protein
MYEVKANTLTSQQQTGLVECTGYVFKPRDTNNIYRNIRSQGVAIPLSLLQTVKVPSGYKEGLVVTPHTAITTGVRDSAHRNHHRGS